MYVSIDRENLKFLHKHEDIHVVCNLVHIEAPHIAICIMAYDSDVFLSDYTGMELAMLYKNTSGHDHSGRSNSALRAILAEMAERLPTSDVNKFELDRQAASIPEDNDQPFRYVKGATRPGKPLAELFPLRADRNADEDAVAASAKQRPAQRTATVASTNTPAAPVTRPQRAPAAPRQGGVRAVIWDVADGMWEKEGKPTGKAEVLSLRKRVMDVLESDHAVKRTSSSNELGQWQKARLTLT